jgi:hypothetical protein
MANDDAASSHVGSIDLVLMGRVHRTEGAEESHRQDDNNRGNDRIEPVPKLKKAFAKQECHIEEQFLHFKLYRYAAYKVQLAKRVSNC